jgi:hypothetical protein
MLTLDKVNASNLDKVFDRGTRISSGLGQYLNVVEVLLPGEVASDGSGFCRLLEGLL